ncbi:MAG: FISUMP domain-containing protein [Dysgonomonas sp.]|nr:FISUMP domain-containing protein [Dysgonomonas sp.]
MKPKYILLLPALAITLAMQAQVTIGSNQKPGAATLLDIVGINNGLAMPRVSLTEENMLYPMFKDSVRYTTQKSIMDNDHQGLWVYNVAECQTPFPRYKGLYVWDGSRWDFLGKEGVRHRDVHEFTDPRDKEVYLYRRFGDAGEWMLQNLRYDPTLTGNDENGEYTDYYHLPIVDNSPLVSADGTKKFAYSDGDPNLIASPYTPGNYPNADWLANKKHYGLLYNYAAALNDGTDYTKPANQILVDEGEKDGDPTLSTYSPRRGICPEGWYVPSDREWNDLEKEIHTKAYLYSYYTKAQVEAPFDEDGFGPWNDDWRTINSDRPHYPYDGGPNATFNTIHPGRGLAMLAICPANLSCGGKGLTAEQGGFDIRYSGVVSVSNYVHSFEQIAYFWTSSRLNIYPGFYLASAYGRSSVCNNKAAFVRGAENLNQKHMLSVRCKRDTKP